MGFYDDYQDALSGLQAMQHNHSLGGLGQSTAQTASHIDRMTRSRQEEMRAAYNRQLLDGSTRDNYDVFRDKQVIGMDFAEGAPKIKISNPVKRKFNSIREELQYDTDEWLKATV